ncbi:hypothetical protein D3C71_2161530 [compost metagenome]
MMAFAGLGGIAAARPLRLPFPMGVAAVALAVQVRFVFHYARASSLAKSVPAKRGGSAFFIGKFYKR